MRKLSLLTDFGTVLIHSVIWQKISDTHVKKLTVFMYYYYTDRYAAIVEAIIAGLQAH